MPSKGSRPRPRKPAFSLTSTRSPVGGFADIHSDTPPGHGDHEDSDVYWDHNDNQHGDEHWDQVARTTLLDQLVTPTNIPDFVDRLARFVTKMESTFKDRELQLDKRFDRLASQSDRSIRSLEKRLSEIEQLLKRR